MHRWGVRVRDEATTAPGFVQAHGADGAALIGFEDALGIVGGWPHFIQMVRLNNANRLPV